MRLDVVVVFTVQTAKMMADKANTALAADLLPRVASKKSCRIEARGWPDSARSPSKRFVSPAHKVTRIATTMQVSELTVVESSKDLGISV